MDNFKIFNVNTCFLQQNIFKTKQVNYFYRSLQRDMQRRIRRERIRRVGSELSLSSTAPLLHRTTTQLSNPVQHVCFC